MKERNKECCYIVQKFFFDLFFLVFLLLADRGLPFYYQTLDTLEEYLGKNLAPSEMSPQELLTKSGGRRAGVVGCFIFFLGGGEK